MCPDILREIFVSKIGSYNFCRNNTFERRQVDSVYHGTESLSLLGPMISGLVPLEFKQLKSLEVFKSKRKKWIPFECPRRLCRTYTTSLRCLCDSIYKYICQFLAFSSFV